MKNILILIKIVVLNIIRKEKNHRYSDMVKTVWHKSKLEAFILKCEDNHTFSTLVDAFFDILIAIIIIRVFFHIVC